MNLNLLFLATGNYCEPEIAGNLAVGVVTLAMYLLIRQTWRL
jgi:hypothetical protein